MEWDGLLFHYLGFRVRVMMHSLTMTLLVGGWGCRVAGNFCDRTDDWQLADRSRALENEWAVNDL